MAVATEIKPKAAIRTQVDGDAIATLVLDRPRDKVNIIDVAFIEEFVEVLEALDSDLKGLILTSGKEGQFVAGADLEMILQAQEPEQAAEMVRLLHRGLNRLEALPFPSVAAIGGPALGGGLELALACDYRVVVESEANILGLPEVQLGLLPAGGGSQRLPRLVGLSRALGLILEGKRYNSRRAKKYGVVDEAVHPAALSQAARTWISRGKRRSHPAWSRLDRVAARSRLVRGFIYRQARAGIVKKTKSHYPAPFAALEVIRAGQEQGMGAGLAAEAVRFGELASGDVARNLIHLFFATEGLKKEQRQVAEKAAHVERIGVVGGGFMGSGIAQASAVAGFATRVRDIEAERVAKAIKSARDLTQSAARKGRFSRRAAAEIGSRISGTTDYSGFQRAQLVIEAVFEDAELKRKVIAELEGVVGDRAVIASNTSSLPIATLAEGAKHPERIVGMHFFSPVHKMPLLEIVQAPRSSAEAVATTVEVGREMGKTVIVVNDGPGFYTTRVLGFMAQEAGRLFDEGAAIEDIDAAAVAFGFPVGPLVLTDEVGVDVGAHVGEVLAQAFPDCFTASAAIKAMVRNGWLGRKSKVGFYVYGKRGKKPNADLYAMRQQVARRFPKEELQQRLALAFVNEAARCLSEEVIASPRDGDVAAVMGIGFPPFLGGPFRYADAIGPQALVDQLQHLASRHGSRFQPAPALLDLASSGGRFYPV